MHFILLFLLIIIPFQKSFANNCIPEFMPTTKQILNDQKLGQYASSLSKKSDLNSKVGIITYGAATVKVKKASMLQRYQQSAKMQAQKNFLQFSKKSSSTIKGMVILESCKKAISSRTLMVIKVFSPI